MGVGRWVWVDNGTANSRVAHDVLFVEWERQLGVCMGVLGKSRQGCVGVINNIGALNNASTPVMYMYYSWESWWVDGLIMKRVRGGGGEAHENCMGPTLPLVQASHTVHT